MSYSGLSFDEGQSSQATRTRNETSRTASIVPRPYLNSEPLRPAYVATAIPSIASGSHLSRIGRNVHQTCQVGNGGSYNG